MSSDSQPAARGAAPLALLPASSKPAKSVTYVAGLKCYLCLRSLRPPCRCSILKTHGRSGRSIRVRALQAQGAGQYRLGRARAQEHGVARSAPGRARQNQSSRGECDGGACARRSRRRRRLSRPDRRSRRLRAGGRNDLPAGTVSQDREAGPRGRRRAGRAQCHQSRRDDLRSRGLRTYRSRAQALRSPADDSRRSRLSVAESGAGRDGCRVRAHDGRSDDGGGRVRRRGRRHGFTGLGAGGGR